MQFVFATSNDLRVCPICESLRGTIYEIAEIVPNMPVHSNCRCRLLLFNDTGIPLLPYIPSVIIVAALDEEAQTCPEGYHWDDGVAGCVPDEQ